MANTGRGTRRLDIHSRLFAVSTWTNGLQCSWLCDAYLAEWTRYYPCRDRNRRICRIGTWLASAARSLAFRSRWWRAVVGELVSDRQRAELACPRWAVAVSVKVQCSRWIVKDDALWRGWGAGARQKLGSCQAWLPRGIVWLQLWSLGVTETVRLANAGCRSPGGSGWDGCRWRSERRTLCSRGCSARRPLLLQEQQRTRPSRRSN
jgi:hypothetical protein